ncbi:WRKY DNA-binding transcription factor 70-like [Prosopis cineraria]|uniref:WRKY DNA-binding transcription factor 70-like n=1 Tax=Prosopis cineraria TaxID=364024 RepID=UPI00240F00B7|nr:WRKY DNA-binding transcription factor 70-like [Prosopis cineraria]
MEKQAIVEELVRGREFANQLLQLLRQGSNYKGNQESFLSVARPFGQDLLTEILRSFTNTFLLLNNTTDPDIQSHDVSFFSDSSSARNIYQGSEVAGDVGVNCKSFINGRSDNQRGCYKRKRSTQTWEKDSPILIDDGYAWRKYGQKMTTNARYLKNYYRCSHRQVGCSAMKQVQRIQEKPPLYRTTYIGIHSCKNHNMLPEMTLALTSPSDSSILLNFNDNTSFHHHFFSSSSTNDKKERDDEENIPIIDHDDRHVDVEQNHVPEYDDHVPTLLSSTLDMFSYYEVVDDVLLMRCFDFDDFARFGK